MELASSSHKQVAINRWLPYWAVLQADLQQTFQSWIYRFWVLLSIGAAVGYLLYRMGLANEAGMIQPASKLVADLLRWTLIASVSLVVVLTAGTISAERGTMADSVLSRGISRHQYFLGKWHSRLFLVLATFLGLAGALLIACLMLLHEDLSPLGCLVGLGTASALLMAIVTCGVSVSAFSNSTLLGVALLWGLLYGGGFLLSLLPSRIITPDRALASLPYILQGHYDSDGILRLVGGCLIVSVLAALAGLTHFAQRDI